MTGPSNRPNVHLVLTDGRGIDSIDETGINANGQNYDLDCTIYGTGFEVGTTYTHRSDFLITGRSNLTIDEKWSEGALTYHGFLVNHFPNIFLVSTLQSGYAASFGHMLFRQGKHIAYILKTCKERGIKTVECTKEAGEEWTHEIVKGQRRSASFQQECTPGYCNLEGTLNDSIVTKRRGTCGAGTLAFCKVMED